MKTTIWKDKAYAFSRIPPELAGLTLFQIAYEVAVPTIEIVSNKDATVYIALSNDKSKTVGDALKAENWTFENESLSHDHSSVTCGKSCPLFLEGKDPSEKNPKKFESVYSKNINSENPVTLNRAKLIPNPSIVQFALLIRESKFWLLSFLVIKKYYYTTYDFFINEQLILISFILQKKEKNTEL